MLTAFLCLSSFAAGFALLYLIHKLLKQTEDEEERPKELRVCPFMRNVCTIENEHSNLCSVLLTESDSSLSRQHVQRALSLLWRKQPMLRMKFATRQGCDVDHVDCLTEIQDDQESIDFQEIDEELSTWKTLFENKLSEAAFDVFSDKPLWRVLILREVFDSNAGVFKNAIFFVFHHFICDGISFLKLHDQFLELLHKVSENNGQETPVEGFSLQPSVYQLAEKETQMSISNYLSEYASLLRQWLECKFIQRGLISMTISQVLQAFPPVILRDPATPIKTRLLNKRLTKEETRALVENCRRNKSTVSGALSAAASIAFGKILDNQVEYSISSGIAVSLRNRYDTEIPADYLGCYISAMPHCTAHFSLRQGHLSPSFWKIADDITSQIKTLLKDKKYNDFLKSSRLQSRMRKKLQDVNGVWYNGGVEFYTSNLGHHEVDPREERAYRIRDLLWATPTHAPGPAFRHSIMTLNGQLSWTLVYANHIVTAETAEKYLDEIFHSLSDL